MPGTFLIQNTRSSREISVKLLIFLPHFKFRISMREHCNGFLSQSTVIECHSTVIRGEEQYFSIQVTGEALWQWRQIKPTYPENDFWALNKSLEKLCYEISSHASDTLGRRIKIEVNFLIARLDGKFPKQGKS